MSADSPIAGVEIVELKRLKDARGWFLKVLMAQHLGADVEFGEIYVSTSEGGAIRGNHVHHRTTEWFVPISGSGKLVLISNGSDHRVVIDLRASAPVRVRVPPGVAHAFCGSDDEPLLLLAYADVPYDPADTDTFPVSVL